MNWFRRGRREPDLQAEIDAHLALETERHIERGETPEAARAHARREFGNVLLVKEVTRAMWWPRLLDLVEQDLRYGLRATGRLFRRDLGVALVAVLTLACAIGANTVVFSGINTLILKSDRVGIGHPRALVDFGRKNSAELVDFFSYPDFEKYRDRHELFAGVAAISFPQGTGVHIDGGPVEVLDVAPVSGGYFQVLEIAPAAGRLLTPDDDRAAAEPVAVISHTLWRTHFDARPDAIGRRIRIGTHSYAIVGIAPPLDSTLLLTPDVWLPLSTHPSAARLKEPHFNYLALKGRLAPGASVQQAQAALDAEPSDAATREAPIRLAHEIWLDSVKPIIAMLMTAAAVLLLIACANVAGIGLARATSRRREIAVRLALGASRFRIVTQLLIETMVMFLVAGVIGAGIAPVVTRALSAEADIDIVPDWHVFAFTLALTLVAALFAGVTPAFHATRTDPGAVLKDDGSTTTYRRVRSRKALVAAQIALSLVLLVGCGLFLHTLRRISTDLGFDPTGVQIVSLDLKAADISDVDGKAMAATLVQRASTLPGVHAASLAWGVPVVSGQFTLSVLVPGLQSAPPDGLPVPQNGVTPGYFKTLQIPIVKGRDFDSGDHAGPPDQGMKVLDWSPDMRGVAIVNQTLAARLWRDADPIGQRFYTCGAVVETCAVEVVGVVGDTRTDVAAFSSHEPMVYRPFVQSYMPQVFVIVRSDRSAQAVPAIREIVRGMNAEIPTLSAQSLDDAMGEKLGLYRLGAATAGGMSGVGLLLVSLGIYGVVAYGVSARRKEIGIRTALGAQPGRVVRLMLREGLQVMVIGVAVGCALASGAATFIASAVPGLARTDWPALILSAIAVGAIACAASYLPARSAAKTDPLVVLRQN